MQPTRSLRRRKFLTRSGRAILGASLLPLAARAQENRVTPGPQAGKSGESLVAELENLIPELMKEALLPGLSIALVQDAKLIWRRGFGVRGASKEPVDDNTVFEAASVSKTVFAYAVMKLCEKGNMDLDIPLAKYAPRRFLEGDPRLDLVTARHVLSHTSGFQDWRSKATPLRIHFTPGEKFLYSGEGYHYLQSVLTQLTGQVNPKACATYEAGLEVCATDFDGYMKRNLLAPFGMSSSGYVWNDTFERHAAQPHRSTGEPFAKASVQRKSGFIILTNGDSGGRVLNDPALALLLGRLIAG